MYKARCSIVLLQTQHFYREMEVEMKEKAQSLFAASWEYSVLQQTQKERPFLNKMKAGNQLLTLVF